MRQPRPRARVDYMKLSQDATNEIWSVILKAEFATPGARKRAIERQIRHALEVALGKRSTTGGWDEDDLPNWLPMFGNSEPTVAQRNPYEGGKKKHAIPPLR